MVHIIFFKYSKIITSNFINNCFFFTPFSLEFNSKRLGILLIDYILITIFYNRDKKLYIGINIIVFLIYMKILFLINVNPIKLYTKYLKNDDKKFKDENCFSYLKRI